jgi:hypothetical protein
LDPVKKLIWISKIKEKGGPVLTFFCLWFAIMGIGKLIGILIEYLFMEGGNNP